MGTRALTYIHNSFDEAPFCQLSNSEQVHAGVEPTMSILSGDRRESYAAFLAKEAYVIADAMIAARKGGAE